MPFTVYHRKSFNGVLHIPSYDGALVFPRSRAIRRLAVPFFTSFLFPLGSFFRPFFFLSFFLSWPFPLPFLSSPLLVSFPCPSFSFLSLLGLI